MQSIKAELEKSHQTYRDLSSKLFAVEKDASNRAADATNYRTALSQIRNLVDRVF